MLKQGVVILTHKGSKWKEFVKINSKILKNANINYIIAENGKNTKYELLAFEKGIKDYEEFIILQDSILLKNADIIKEMFSIDGSVFLSTIGYCMFNKYLTKYVLETGLPEVKTKIDAVEKLENDFNRRYRQVNKVNFIHLGCIENSCDFIEKNGRINNISDNEFFTKYRGTWDISQITN